MKKLSAGSPHTKFIAAASAFIWTIAIANSGDAAQLQEARVTQVVNDVKLMPEQAAPRPAVVSDLVRHGNAVRTGTQSRSELTFADLTITRLGANTIFSFKEGTREMTLTDGAILFQVPKGSGGATIRTVGVTAAITGTTGIGEFHPATTSHPQPFSKWLCLEGTFRLYLPNGQSVEVGPGKMVTTDGKSFSKVLTFDIAKLTSTSLFFTGFDQPLASMNLIVLESQNQLASSLLATTTTNPLDPTRIVNVTSQALVAEETQTSPSSSVSPPPPTPPPPTPPPTTPPPTTPPPPTSTPGKFGTPTVITSPVPYLITSGTVITTDPSITTNGVTDYGKIYRGPVADGAFSLWAFGSTSAFDTALDIDNFFADPNRFPIAAFKFQSLSLNGNPIIDTSNSGVTKLALIGVDGITSGPPGGTLTFTGLDLLALGTVNGSINLTSDVSFQDLSELVMYARGAGSNLTLNSPISNIGTLELAAEGSIQLTNPGTMSVGDFHATAGGDLTLQLGGSLLLDGSVRFNTLVLTGTTVASGANLTLNVTGDYTNSSATEFSRLRVTNEGHIGTGGNISVNIGGNLTATGAGSATDFPAPGDIELLVQNTNAQIDNGGNLDLTVNGNVQVNGLIAYLQNYDETANPAGHIGTGGNIDIEIGGNLTANSYVDVFLNNRAGGMIDSGGNLTFNVGGALTVGPGPMSGNRYVEFVVSNRYDDSAGNTTPPAIGSDVSLFMHAGSVNITLPPGPDTFFSTYIGNRGGTIDGNASVNFNVSHDVSVLCDADIDILNDGGTDVLTPVAGTIHGNATLQASAANFSANSLGVDFTNRNGGVIDSNATLGFNLSGNLTTQGDAFFEIANQQNGFSNGAPGGSIGLAATLDISAANISTGTDFTAQILNHRAAGAPGPGAGFIGTDATLNISASSFAVGGGFDASIFNQDAGVGGGTGGSIGGSANVSLNATGNMTVSGANGITLQILNEGGSIAGGMPGDGVSYTVGGTTSTPSLELYVDNSNGGVINTGGNVTLNTTGPVMMNGPLGLEIDNFNGGSITNGANVMAHFVGDVTDTTGQFHSLNFFVLNGAGFFSSSVTGGTIGTGGNVNVAFDGNAETTPTSTTGSFAAIIANGGGTIGTGGNISLTVGGLVVAGGQGFNVDIENQGGQITNGGNVTVQVAGDVTSSTGAFFGVLNNGGSIGSGTNVTVNVGGNLTTQADAAFQIVNNDDGNGSGPGTIGSDATVNVTANNISTGGRLFADIYNYSGGTIGGNAAINVNAANITADSVFTEIDNSNGGQIGSTAAVSVILNQDLTTTNLTTALHDIDVLLQNQAGTIGSDAGVALQARDLTSAGAIVELILNNAGTIGGGAAVNLGARNVSTGTTDLNIGVYNASGAIGGPASVIFVATGDVNATGNSFFQIGNNLTGVGAPSASIGNDATVSVSSANFSTTGQLVVATDNTAGTIGGNVALGFAAGTNINDSTAFFRILNSNDGNGSVAGTIEGAASMDVSWGGTFTSGYAEFSIFNGGGLIGSDATITLNGANITADSLIAQIDNTGGSIGASTEGGATINMNVSGTATVTNDATVAIYGSGGAGSAAININGGSYNVGGTFLTYIDGNGTITFNNASAHADVLKAGVFGANGALNVGGGTLSADSILKLYAPGSNGQLNFMSNVTLGGNSMKILAANSVTIFNNIVVTIGGPNPADVYTNNANYTGSGGNGTTTGTFAGARANDPLPLSNAPPFGLSSPAPITTRTRIHPRPPVTTGVINVSSSDELLALLDDAAPGRDGRIRIPDSRTGNHGRNASRINTAAYLNAARRAIDRQTASTPAMRRLPQ